MLQIRHKGRGKILEPSASKNDSKKTQQNAVVVVVQMLTVFAGVSRTLRPGFLT